MTWLKSLFTLLQMQKLFGLWAWLNGLVTVQRWTFLLGLLSSLILALSYLTQRQANKQLHAYQDSAAFYKNQVKAAEKIKAEILNRIDARLARIDSAETQRIQAHEKVNNLTGNNLQAELDKQLNSPRPRSKPPPLHPH